MVHIWTIKIGNNSKSWKEITFDRTISSDPTEFTAKIAYDVSISKFNTVQILNNDTLEWYGYVENIIEEWDENGKFLRLWGRDRKVLLWKKWTERFNDTRTEGFFGNVDPVKLVKFLLRCPVSEDSVLEYDTEDSCTLNGGKWDSDGKVCLRGNGAHRIGWGIDSTNWTCTAKHSDGSDATADGRAVFYPKTRLMGFSWALGSGVQYPNLYAETLTNVVKGWTDFGDGSLGHDETNISGIKGPTAIDTLVGMLQDLSFTSLTQDVSAGATQLKVSDSSIFSSGDSIVITTLSTLVLSHGPAIRKRECTSISSIPDSTTINLSSPLSYSFSTAFPTIISKRYTITQEYYSFEDSPFPTIDLTTVNLVVKGKRKSAKYASTYPESKYNVNITGTFVGQSPSVSLAVFIDIGSGFSEIGSLTWTYSETDFLNKSMNLTSIIDTVTKLNNCKVKLVATVDYSANIELSEMKISFNADSYQHTGDYFLIDMGEVKSRVCGVYIECRGIGGSNNYARNYEILTSSGTEAGPWTGQATQLNNICRDIIESWVPISARYLKIRILADSPTTWEISQIYIYQSDDKKYCIWNEGLGTTLGPYLSGIYTADNYITETGTPLTPINIPFGRLNETIGDIIDKIHENYVTWEWDIDFNTGDFYLVQQLGEDKYSTIKFNNAEHIGQISKSSDSRNATSRVKVIGKSESKLADEVSSEWQTGGEDYTDNETELGTFYENIVSAKRVSNKLTANVMANVEAKMNGRPEDQIEIPINNDPYDPMAYDVGDIVGITDTNTSMNDSKCRIYSIHKSISISGEKISLFVDSRYKNFSDEWVKIRKQVKELGLVTNTVEDWLADGANQNKIDGNKVTESWNKTAKNEEQFVPNDIEDEAWQLTGRNENGQEMACTDNWFYMRGSKVADDATYLLKAFVSNNVNLDGSVGDSGITYASNPKFVADFKIYVTGTNPNDGTSWKDGDNLFIGMANTTYSSYFGFFIMRYQEQYNLYVAVKQSTNPYATSLWVTKDVNGTPIIIDENTKYHIDAEVDWETLVIKFSFNSNLIAILPISSAYSTDSLQPLSLQLMSSNPSSGVSYWDTVLIYKLKSEWELNE